MSQIDRQRKVDKRVANFVLLLLEKYFPNGIRFKSRIDINKLKHRFHVDTGEVLSLTDSDVSLLLQKLGISHGEKVFAIPLSVKQNLLKLLNRLIREGHRLFFYDEFYDIHADLLLAMNIFSSGLLKTVLTRFFPLHYSRDYFSKEGDDSVKSEVLRCYETTVCLSYDQLKAKLPYIPIEKLKQFLTSNKDDFVLVNTGVYAHLGKIEIDKNDQITAKNTVKDDIARYGYSTLASFDVSATLELNPEISEIAAKNGLFQVCLADRYEKRSNIITPQGTVINPAEVFKGFCLKHDRLTREELADFAKEINGETNGQILGIAYDTMIRVDKETFVSDGKIDFDIEATDNALDLFIHSGIIPLKAISSFTSFPYIDGYSWNWFLLESYCRRFSKRFMYKSLSNNNENVGAIYQKSLGFEHYTDVLAEAVAASNIELTEQTVGDYLFENRYVARRTGKVSTVVQKARTLRNGRV